MLFLARKKNTFASVVESLKTADPKALVKSKCGQVFVEDLMNVYNGRPLSYKLIDEYVLLLRDKLRQERCQNTTILSSRCLHRYESQGYSEVSNDIAAL